MSTSRRAGLLGALVLLLAPCSASGFIHRLYPLEEILRESTHILVGRLDKVDARARTAVLVVERPLKGKAEFKRVQMNIAVGPAHHGEYIVERLQPGARAILFYQRKGNSIAALVHAGDIWFQLFAADNPRQRGNVWWRMSHVEVHLGRTYNGPTRPLVKLVGDVLAGRVKPPKPDPNVPELAILTRAKPTVIRPPKGKRGGFYRQLVLRHRGGAEIRGIACADVNGDELLDLLFCRQAGDLLLVNQGAGFRDATSRMGIGGGSRSAAWADYDADDHPDLMTSNFRLFTHVGGALRDHSKRLAAPRARNPEGAGWIDYDADGRPDLLVTNGEHGIRLYQNTGRGPEWFRDVSDQAGLGQKGFGRGNGDFVACLDYDGDGRTDFLYNLGDGVLAHNEGDGTFKPDRSSGIRLANPGTKRGIAAADFDNDGDLDLFVPGPSRAQLYRNNNDGTFTDVIPAAGHLAKVNEPSFAAAWGDVNCDGFLDLLVCHPRGPARLYLGDGKGMFVDVSKAVGVDRLSGVHAASFADVDNDGDLDLVANLADRVVIAFNEIERPARRGPLTVRLHVRRGRIGAVVRVFDPRRRLVGLRELNGAESCGGQASPVAHFGLPTRTFRVSVCLSDGRMAQKPVTIKPDGTRLAFLENEFR